MTQFSKWQQDSKEALKMARKGKYHSFLSQFEMGPLAVEQGNPGVPQLTPSTDSNFFNIVPYHSEIFTEEFSNSPSAGLYLRNQWPENFNDKEVFIYHQASPEMTSFKRALLSDEHVCKMNLGVDPFGLGLWKSTLYKFEISGETLKAVKNRDIKIFRITSQPYAMSGASDTQELAIMLASAVQLIDDLSGVLSPEEVLKQVSFELALKPHIFLGLGKIKACHILMARLMELYKIKDDTYPPIYISSSARYLSAREPWNNILRMASISATAMMAGASGFVCYPYDLFSNKECSSWRVSKNISEVLRLESHLHRVSNPAEGSYSLNEIIDGLLKKSWELFVEIQKKEGLRSILRSGWLLDQMSVEKMDQTEKFLKGALKITASNTFPLVDALSHESPIPKKSDCKSIESWWIEQYNEGESERLCDVARFVPESLLELFEQWQFKSDALRSQNPKSTTIITFVEESLLNSQKVKALQNFLSLAGLKTLFKKPSELLDPSIAVGLVIASDPEGEFTAQCLKVLDSKPCGLKIWAGDRCVKGFDECLSEQTDLPFFFGKVFTHLEGQ